jgi:hypothetical protein
MSCSDCQQTISASDIVNQSLQQLKEYLITGEQSQHTRPDTIITLSKERLDMVAYTSHITWKMAVLKKKIPLGECKCSRTLAQI